MLGFRSIVKSFANIRKALKEAKRKSDERYDFYLLLQSSITIGRPPQKHGFLINGKLWKKIIY